MKIHLRISWEDYFLEATAAEAETLNRLLSRARLITGMGNDNTNVTVNPDNKLSTTLRILRDDCEVTLTNPATPGEV